MTRHFQANPWFSFPQHINSMLENRVEILDDGDRGKKSRAVAGIVVPENPAYNRPAQSKAAASRPNSAFASSIGATMMNVPTAGVAILPSSPSSQRLKAESSTKALQGSREDGAEVKHCSYEQVGLPEKEASTSSLAARRKSSRSNKVSKSRAGSPAISRIGSTSEGHPSPLGHVNPLAYEAEAFGEPRVLEGRMEAWTAVEAQRSPTTATLASPSKGIMKDPGASRKEGVQKPSVVIQGEPGGEEAEDLGNMVVAMLSRGESSAADTTANQVSSHPMDTERESKEPDGEDLTATVARMLAQGRRGQ